MIAEAVKMGCDLVPIGPAGNSMEDEEWRISLVRAERHLVHTLNSAQLKTLVLLKIILAEPLIDGEIDITPPWPSTNDILTMVAISIAVLALACSILLYIL